MANAGGGQYYKKPFATYKKEAIKVAKELY